MGFYEDETKRFKLTKKEVFSRLKELSINTVITHFDGEGDSGGIEGMVCYAEIFDEESPSILGDLTVIPFDKHRVTVGGEDCSLKDQLEELVYMTLWQDHGGWENNDGAYGDIYFLVPKDKVFIEINVRFLDSVSYDHEY